MGERAQLSVWEGERVCHESITEGYTIFVKLGLTAIFNSFLGAESNTDLSFSLSDHVFDL